GTGSPADASGMLDSLPSHAISAASHAGYPLDAGAVLLLEVDGTPEVAEELGQRMAKVCRENGASEVRVARNEAERQALWKGRKGAFSAMGRLSPDFYVMDGVVPRTRLPETLAKIDAISERTGFKICSASWIPERSSPARASSRRRCGCRRDIRADSQVRRLPRARTYGCESARPSLTRA